MKIIGLLILLTTPMGCSRSLVPQLGMTAVVASSADKAQILTSLRAKSEELTSYKTLLKSKFSVGKDSWTVRQAVVLQQPNLLRIDMLPPVGFGALAILLVKDKQALFLDVMEKKFSQEPATVDWFIRYVKLPLSEQELMSVLTRRLLISTWAENDITIKKDAENIYLMKGNHFLIKLDPATLLIKEGQLWDQFKGKVVLSFIYKEGISKEGNPSETPTSLEMVIPKLDLSISSQVLSSTINSAVKKDVFELAVPPDYVSY